MNKKYKIWYHKQKETEEDVIEGSEFDVIKSKFGASEYIIEFLKDTKLWDSMIKVKPKLLKKGNGKDWKKINEIMVVKELAGVRTISSANKVIRDGNLMTSLGFNLELIKEKESEDKGIVHQDTLRNHLKRIPIKESIKSFYKDHVNLLRKKKWIRGGVYAIDGYNIEIFGEEYEGYGEVWDPIENRHKKGYKLLLLVNVKKDRVKILGAILGKINDNEVKMARKLFKDIERYVCPIKELIDILLMDRAYWDEKFLRYLKEENKIDFVILAKENLNIVKDDLRDLIKLDRIKFNWYKTKNRKYKPRKTDKELKKQSKEKEYLEIELGVEKKLDYKVFKEGYLNIVIKKDKKKGKNKDNNKEKYEYTFYTTTLEIKNPVKIVNLYKDRWVIENNVNRELDQRWFLRTPAGRAKNTIVARTMLVLKLFNSEKILEMKCKGKHKEIKEKMKEKG